MITVGVGASSGVTVDEVLAAIDAVLPAGRTDVQLSTLTKRALEPGIAGAAAARDWPLFGHDAEELAAVAVQDPSTFVADAVGTRSVAEAAALLSGDRLIVGKTVVGRVTVAVAE
ncbi:cobalamin biosynthesis protein [Geodermatophilus sp. URMC 64]